MSSGPRLLAVLLATALCAPSALRAQANGTTNDSESAADSALVLARADSARAVLVQPPGKKGASFAYFVRAPFHLFGASVALVSAAGYGFYQLLDKLGMIDAVKRMDRQLVEQDIHAGVGFIGSRSWPALEVRWDEPDPFFIEGGVSLRGYTLLRGGVALGDTLDGLELAVGQHDRNQLHFWGIGPDSPESDRSDYRIVRRDATLQGWTEVAPGLRLELGAGVEDDELRRGEDDDRPDAQDVFPELFPGDEETDRFAHVGAAATYDLSRVNADYQLTGAWLNAGWRLFRGIDDTDARFQVGTADLQLFAPINRRHAVALRGLAADTWGESGDGIPFYHMPALGSEQGLRGFRSWRFRDRALAAAMAEWRYRVWYHPGDPTYRLDASAFVDHGAVAASLGDLRAPDFETTPGFALRLMKEGFAMVGGYVAFGGDDTARWGLDFETAF
jgi:hypothetical protein